MASVRSCGIPTAYWYVRFVPAVLDVMIHGNSMTLVLYPALTSYCPYVAVSAQIPPHREGHIGSGHMGNGHMGNGQMGNGHLGNGHG